MERPRLSFSFLASVGLMLTLAGCGPGGNTSDLPHATEHPPDGDDGRLIGSVRSGRTDGISQAQADPAVRTDLHSDSHTAGSRSLASTWDLSREEAGALIGQLSGLELPSGTMSPALADDLNNSFREIRALGPAALPVIREFLEKFEDVSFQELEGGEQVGASSLRVALLEIVAGIGTKEADALMVEVLEQTSAPQEIFFLADRLEQRFPGEYLDTALLAGAESLELAASGELYAPDPAPIFALFQKYPDESILPVLTDAAGYWNRYATVALASFPDGQGVGQLTEAIARSRTPTEAEFGIQVLAQAAGHSDEALAALLEHTDAIPDQLWSMVAGLAAGQMRYQMEQPVPKSDAQRYAAQGPQFGSSYTTHIVHNPSANTGRQEVYRVRRSLPLTAAELDSARRTLRTLQQAARGSAADSAVARAVARLEAAAAGAGP